MKTPKIIFGILLILSVALFATGCATLPEEVPRTPSNAYKTPELTSVGQIFADEIAAHPGKSGVALVTDGPKALLIRNAMAGMAEKTLDVLTSIILKSPRLRGLVVWVVKVQGLDFRF